MLDDQSFCNFQDTILYHQANPKIAANLAFTSSLIKTKNKVHLLINAVANYLCLAIDFLWFF